MSERLSRLRRRIALASAAAVALCAAACLAALFVTSSASALDAQRKVLEEVSNAPFEGSDGETGDVPYLAPGAPTWVRALVDAGGDVTAVQASDGGGAYGTGDLAELVALRDDRGSSPFPWGGRTWVALWQPDGAQEGSLVIAAGADGTPAVSDAEASGSRVYTFLDVSEAIASVRALGLGCLAACGAIFLATLAVAWAAAGRALRPVAEAEERERAFVCAASHDLVTPLMAVTANCDVLEAEAPGRADLSPWISNIRAAADEMASRIAEMLARMGRGQAR